MNEQLSAYPRCKLPYRIDRKHRIEMGETIHLVYTPEKRRGN